MQEALRPRYPICEKEETVGLALSSQGARPLPASIEWRFGGLDGPWRVSLGKNFAALETTSYTSREDFFDRYREVLEAVTVHIEPARRDRLGVRYIDQVRGEALSRITQMVRPEMAGLLGSDLAGDVTVGISDYQITAVDHRLVRARWGRLPAGSTIDPHAVPPLNEASWVLDIDASQSDLTAWNVATIMTEAEHLADLAHRLFRWAITPDFLREFGGMQ